MCSNIFHVLMFQEDWSTLVRIIMNHHHKPQREIMHLGNFIDQIQCSPFIAGLIMTQIWNWHHMLWLPIFFTMEFYKEIIEKWSWNFHFPTGVIKFRINQDCFLWMFFSVKHFIGDFWTFLAKFRIELKDFPDWESWTVTTPVPRIPFKTVNL